MLKYATLKYEFKNMKIISLNVERNKHMSKVLSFLKTEKPDVVCLQEVMGGKIDFISKELGMYKSFIPFAFLDSGWEEDANGDGWGVAILSKERPVSSTNYLYKGDGILKNYTRAKWDENSYKIISRYVLLSEFKRNGESMFIGTTHFTYTPDGKPDMLQRQSLNKLLKITEKYKNLFLCGDFNIPRESELYSELKKVFIDNVPVRYDSSLDPELHRIKGLKRMVDYAWSRGDVDVENVFLKHGISDHCAVLANVEIKQNK